jgi:hypothetical protein
MGILAHDLDFLLSARERGVRFTSTLTLGRQELLLGMVDFVHLLRKHGVVGSTREAIEFRERCGRYAEPLFQLLGAEEVTVLDASDYEGAALVHDLNEPIPPELAGRFDVVYDGGTLEHVFNYPVALRNGMSMVKVGGHFIIQTPTNNFCGHGFYQISPELLFRALSPPHGFALDRLLVVEEGYERRWFSVTDPQSIGSRVELTSRHRVTLLAQARRCDGRPPLERYPQESDYVAAWQAPARRVTGRSGRGFARWLKQWSPSVALKLWWWLAVLRDGARRLLPSAPGKRSLKNRRFFHMTAPTILMTVPTILEVL